MRYYNPYDSKGEWFKGALHVHTTNSDGKVSVEKTIVLYEDAGYDFLSITDHNVLTEAPSYSQNGMLLIKGSEGNVRDLDIAWIDAHIVGLGIRCTLTERDQPEQIVEDIKKQGGFCLFGHPSSIKVRPEELVKLDGIDAIEIFNGGAPPEMQYSVEHWDRYLTKTGKPVWGAAVDDMHSGLTDFHTGWVIVRAEALDEASILDALGRGAFFATQGPLFEDIHLDKQTLSLTFTPSERVRFVVAGGRIREEIDTKDSTEAQYRFAGDEKYVRVEIVDNRGDSAWTNPIFIA